MARIKHPPLIEHPTIKDLFVQHFGIQRFICPSKAVKDTKKWNDWIALVDRISDAELIGLREKNQKAMAVLVVLGQYADASKQGYLEFELRDHYRTPEATIEKELSSLLHSRRTEGDFRDILVAAISEKRGYMAIREGIELEGIPLYMVRFAEKKPAGPSDPAVIDTLSDWDLVDEWSGITLQAAFHELADMMAGKPLLSFNH